MHPIDAARGAQLPDVALERMPGALRPIDPATREPFHPDDIWKQLRLSSKSHWDVPVRTPKGVVHFLVSHPTPPVFDGPEDRNGKRNPDEIRLWTRIPVSRRQALAVRRPGTMRRTGRPMRGS